MSAVWRKVIDDINKSKASGALKHKACWCIGYLSQQFLTPERLIILKDSFIVHLPSQWVEIKSDDVIRYYRKPCGKVQCYSLDDQGQWHSEGEASEHDIKRSNGKDSESVHERGDLRNPSPRETNESSESDSSGK